MPVWAVVIMLRGHKLHCLLKRSNSGPAARDATVPFDYILGCPLRRERAVAEEVLARPGRYQAVPDNLEVKEVRLGESRYVVCRNPMEAKQDAADREALLAKLRHTLSTTNRDGRLGELLRLRSLPLRSHGKQPLDLPRLGQIPLLPLKERGFGGDPTKRRQILWAQSAGQHGQDRS